MSDKCPQTFVQFVGQMSANFRTVCRTNVHVGQMSASDKCPVTCGTYGSFALEESANAFFGYVVDMSVEC